MPPLAPDKQGCAPVTAVLGHRFGSAPAGYVAGGGRGMGDLARQNHACQLAREQKLTGGPPALPAAAVSKPPPAARHDNKQHNLGPPLPRRPPCPVLCGSRAGEG